MTVKAWRVLKIVSGGLRKVKVTTKQVVVYTAALVAVVAVILVLYSAVGTPHVAYVAVPLATGNLLLKPYCTTRMPAFDYVLYAIEATSLAVASYLCYRTKDTPDAVNESKFIALAVFLIVFVSVAGLPIVLSLPLDPYLSQVRWPAWKCVVCVEGPSHPGTPTRTPGPVPVPGVLARLDVLQPPLCRLISRHINAWPR